MPYDYSEVPNEHARLDFSNFLSTLLNKRKTLPAPLLIYLVNKQAGGSFFQPCLSIMDFRVSDIGTTSRPNISH